MIGQECWLNGLSSEKGKRMNGCKSRVIGIDDLRMKVELLEGGCVGEKVSVRSSNISMVKPVRFSGTLLDREKVLSVLQRVQKSFEKERDWKERKDMMARFALLDRAVSAYADPDAEIPIFSCMENLVPEAEMSDHMRVLDLSKPACAGDGKVDFRRLAEGLVGDFSTCAICLEVTLPDSTAFALPCSHVFHQSCATEWLKRENCCPTCRKAFPGKGYNFVRLVRGEDEIFSRLREWVISGRCQRCLFSQDDDPAVMMDNHPHFPNGTVMVPLSEATRVCEMFGLPMKWGDTVRDSRQTLGQGQTLGAIPASLQ
uniref:RING-type domain-containing protein n=1 Tax=Chromera velia CCMP2878 TaxID=1169474 RepID=A0A0G4FH01_9ALVE|eukprot:Cvel_16949.t1-p1 / transcript=Cvel_16949.t1 / gene=Cvel_16949 / organism=Chromera_velia_CCMP2878 / gene_product=E3 ubiquitin-protein ligase RING1, putative / transcript_product=E3 ubiquitin-protein ligase RING1, putative / location=Cvel_scaffold1329:27676-28614(-) / protein_length=313 / sequence_SO=supercontig / SO=protein_coding / is_pseudo=false